MHTTRSAHQRQAGLSRSLRAMLFCAPLLDEMTVGFFVVALPLLRDELHLSYEQAGLLFTFGALSSMLFEPPINVVSDRIPRRIPLIAGLLVLVGSYLLAGFAQAYLVLALALVILYPATGVVAGMAQSLLIDDAPRMGERTMTRWTIMAGIGDLLAPLAVVAITSLSLGWKSLCLLAAAIWLGATLVIAPRHLPTGPSHAAAADHAAADQPRISMLAGVRATLADRELLRWVGIVILATMPDEIFLGFAALYLRDHLHASSLGLSSALGANLAGGMLGLLLLERLQARIRGIHLLPWLALLALGGTIITLAASGVWLASVGLALVGFGASGWYPVAKAAAYARQPGRSGMVRAVISLGDPIEIALPGVVGVLAGRFGLGAALAFLGASSLGVLILALGGIRMRGRVHSEAPINR